MLNVREKSSQRGSKNVCLASALLYVCKWDVIKFVPASVMKADIRLSPAISNSPIQRDQKVARVGWLTSWVFGVYSKIEGEEG